MSPRDQPLSITTGQPSVGTPVREGDGPLPTLRGRYEIFAELGRGSGGVVYRAFDQLRRRPVALKSLWTHGASRDWLREHGHHVFGVLARVAHPALPSVLDWGFDPSTGRVYYTRAFVEGVPGAELVGRLTARSVAQLGALLVEALDLLHRLGYCHGDLKPGNVLIDRADPAQLRACLIDFGLLFRPGTQESGARGTYPYIAPELILGAAPSPASDLYALGATLYHTLYGAAPRDARDVALHTLREDALAFAAPPPGWEPPADEADARAYGALRRVLALLLHAEPEARALDRASALLKPWAFQASEDLQDSGPRVFFGRDRALADAQGWASGHGPTPDARVLWIHGVEGVGKRTFAAMLSERVRVERPELVALHCAGATSSAHDVIEELLRQALLACPEHIDDAAGALLELFAEVGDWDDPTARRARMRRNALRLVALARRAPLWVVVEAPREAADHLSEALAQLVPQDRVEPLSMCLVVCCAAPPPQGDDTSAPLPPLHAVELQALSRDDAEAVLRHSLPNTSALAARLVSDAPSSRLPARLRAVAHATRGALQRGLSPDASCAAVLGAERADGLALEAFDRMAAPERHALCVLIVAQVAMTAHEIYRVLRLPNTLRLDWRGLAASSWVRAEYNGGEHAPRYAFALGQAQGEAALKRSERVEAGLIERVTQRAFKVLRRRPSAALSAWERVGLVKLAAAAGGWEWLGARCRDWVAAWIGRNEPECLRAVLGVLDAAAQTPGGVEAFALPRAEARWGVQDWEGVEQAARDAIASWADDAAWPEALRAAFSAEDPALAPKHMDWPQALRAFEASLSAPDAQPTPTTLSVTQLRVLLLAVRANHKRNRNTLAAWRMWALLPEFRADLDEHLVLTFCRAVFDVAFGVFDADDASFVDALMALSKRRRSQHGFDVYFECRLLYLCGVFYQYKGRFEPAAKHYERAYALSWEDEVRCGLIRLKVVYNLTTVYGGENQALLRHNVQRGLADAKRYGSDELMNAFEARTITLLIYQCRFFEAYETATRVFKRSQRDPFRGDLGSAASGLALALGALGLDDQLLKLRRFILGEPRYVQLSAGVAWISAALRVGLVREAVELLELVSRHTPDSPDHLLRRLLPMYWMWAHVLEEDWERAALYQARTQRVVEQEDSGGWTRASALMVLVRYWIAKKDLVEARRCQDALDRILEEHGYEFLRPVVLHRRGELAWACNKPSEARQAVEEAAAIVRRWADRLPEAWADPFLGSLRQAEILRDARAWGEEGQQALLLEQTREIVSIAQRLMRASALGAASVFKDALKHAVRFVGAERAVLYHAERIDTEGPLPPQALEGGEPTVVSLEGQGSSVQRWRLTPIEALGFGDALPKAPSVTVMRNLLSSGAPVFSDDAPRDRRLSHSHSIIQTDVRSILALPLRDGDTIRGVVYLDSTQWRRFSSTDRALMGLLGDQIGPVLHSVQLRDSIQGKRERFPRILGSSPAIQRLLDIADKAARSELSVLILGPTGTGKSLLARSIHDASARHTGPFVKVDFGEVTEELFTAELFGAARGAYTGALGRRGLVEDAQGGTLFLDEMGELPPKVQSKLLNFLQDRKVRRVGQNLSRVVDVRIIAATNRPLPKLVETGDFREDLFYRLNGLQITMPSLAERREDIPLLVLSHFHRVIERQDLDRPQPSPELLKALQELPWQGNIRQLFHAVERAIALAEPGLPLAFENFVTDAGLQDDAPRLSAPPVRAREPAEPLHPEEGSLEWTWPPGHAGSPTRGAGAQPPSAPAQAAQMAAQAAQMAAQTWPGYGGPWLVMPAQWGNPAQAWAAYPPMQGWYGSAQGAPPPSSPYAPAAPHAPPPPAGAWFDPNAQPVGPPARSAAPAAPPSDEPLSDASPPSPPWREAPARGMDGALHATRLWMVKRALDATHGNKAEAARRLGISRRTLYNILQADESAED